MRKPWILQSSVYQRFFHAGTAIITFHLASNPYLREPLQATKRHTVYRQEYGENSVLFLSNKQKSYIFTRRYSQPFLTYLSPVTKYATDIKLPRLGSTFFSRVFELIHTG
jgi:hypothetical protein